MPVSSGLFLTYAKVLDPAMALAKSELQQHAMDPVLWGIGSCLCLPLLPVPEPGTSRLPTALLTASRHIER